MGIYSDEQEGHLIPAEYSKNFSPAAEGWPAILYKLQYLPAEKSPTFYDTALGKSVFRFPSVLPSVFSFNSALRDDYDGAKAWLSQVDHKYIRLVITCNSC